MNLIEEIGDHYQRALNTVGGSGIDWVDKVFKICVIFLVDLADFFGMTYEEINIWVFVIIWPTLTMSAIIWIVLLKRKIRRLQKEKN